MPARRRTQETLRFLRREFARLDREEEARNLVSHDAVGINALDDFFWAQYEAEQKMDWEDWWNQ
jgi:hypothetical protein